MRPSKTALGLAIAAALTVPFVAGTSRPRANAQEWIALTSAQRAEIAAKLESSKNCCYFETQVEARDVLGLKVDTKDIDDAIQCHREQDALRDGGELRPYFSLPRYLAINILHCAGERSRCAWPCDDAPRPVSVGSLAPKLGKSGLGYQPVRPTVTPLKCIPWINAGNLAECNLHAEAFI
jgi:hypothetical protein